MAVRCAFGFVFNRNLTACVDCASTVPPIPPGSICNGSDSVYPCDRGFFCPSTALSITCPKGSLCRSGVVQPQECFGGGAFTCTDRGQGSSANVIPAAILVAACAVALWVLIHVILKMFDRRREMQSQRKFDQTVASVKLMQRVYPYAMRWRRKTIAARTDREFAATNRSNTPQGQDHGVVGRPRSVSSAVAELAEAEWNSVYATEGPQAELKQINVEDGEEEEARPEVVSSQNAKSMSLFTASLSSSTRADHEQQDEQSRRGSNSSQVSLTVEAARRARQARLGGIDVLAPLPFGRTATDTAVDESQNSLSLSQISAQFSDGRRGSASSQSSLTVDAARRARSLADSNATNGLASSQASAKTQISVQSSAKSQLLDGAILTRRAADEPAVASSPTNDAASDANAASSDTAAVANAVAASQTSSQLGNPSPSRGSVSSLAVLPVESAMRERVVSATESTLLDQVPPLPRAQISGDQLSGSRSSRPSKSSLRSIFSRASERGRRFRITTDVDLPQIDITHASVRAKKALVRRANSQMWKAAEAFADIPKTRSFRHALRTALDRGERLDDIELQNVSVAASFASAAELRSVGIGKPVVQNVSCKMPGGKLIAIMGPSGCGKSTLLKALAAAGEGPQFVTGAVYVGGMRRPLSRPLPESSFMPQESVIYPDLTAEETVRYARLLTRGPFVTKAVEGGEDAPLYDATDELVYEVLDVLGLGGVRGRVVGAEDGAEGERSAVSGGQRRRIVLAMEIVKRPSMLLLDEPTSGLDSTSTLVVMKALRDLANNGTTVIAVIHQPGYRVFKMVDDLVLLTGQGTLAYSGRATGVLEYLESIGYTRPLHASIPEFALDVAIGISRRKNTKTADGPALAGRILSSKWRRHSGRRSIAGSTTSQSLNQSLQNSGNRAHLSELLLRRLAAGVNMGELVVVEPEDSNDGTVEVPYDDEAPQVVRVAWRQFWMVLCRTLVQLSRGRRSLLIDALLMILMSVVITLIYGDVGPFDHGSQHSALGLTLGLTGVIVGLRIFGNDQHVYEKERAAGVMSVPYYFGKLLGSIPMIFINPFMLSLSFCVIMSPRGPLSEYFSAFLLTQWAAVSVAVLCSILLRRKIALPVSVLVVLIAFLCNSITQKEKELVDKLGGFGTFLARISFLSYGTKAISLSEFTRYAPVYAARVSLALNAIGFDVDPTVPFVATGAYAPGGTAWQQLCGDLFAFGVVAFTLAGVSMWLHSKEALRMSVMVQVARVRRGQRPRLRTRPSFNAKLVRHLIQTDDDTSAVAVIQCRDSEV